ncbi:MAG: BMP family ABC transporter substrate-binding protein [Candidatus Heimdallarchaeota archaeon]|nr:BMP family ABC transporter substrate-binding protein [Candidatus Heimdallarchaeota archaeon]
MHQHRQLHQYVMLALIFMTSLSFGSMQVLNADGSTNEENNARTIKSSNTQGFDAVIAVVFNTGGLYAQGYNYVVVAGLVEARNEYFLAMSTVEPIDVPSITSNLLLFGADSENDLVISLGFASADGVTAAAQTYPLTNFTIVDAVVDLPNVASVIFKEHEGSFLAGAMAALTTSSGKLGFLGGMDNPVINRYGSGFEQGARWINPDVEITWVYSPDPNNPWSNVAGGKIVAENMINSGIDIIFSAAGVTGFGVFDAVQEATDAGKKTYAIGADANQDNLKPGTILTSVTKSLDVVVKGQIGDVVAGIWKSGTDVLGVKEGAVNITGMEFTQTEANTTCGNKTRLGFINALADSISNGSITVDGNIVAQADRNRFAHNCTGTYYVEPAPTASPTNSNSEPSSTPSTSDTPTTTTSETSNITTSDPDRSSTSQSGSSNGPIPGFAYYITSFALIITMISQKRIQRKK